MGEYISQCLMEGKFTKYQAMGPSIKVNIPNFKELLQEILKLNKTITCSCIWVFKAGIILCIGPCLCGQVHDDIMAARLHSALLKKQVIMLCIHYPMFMRFHHIFRILSVGTNWLKLNGVCPSSHGKRILKNQSPQ